MTTTSIRSTTTPPLAREATERPRPASPQAVAPVYLERETEADRRRSLREELEAAEERLPQAETLDQSHDVGEVLEELERLGSDALRVLHPINASVRRLVDRTHIDEQV